MAEIITVPISCQLNDPSKAVRLFKLGYSTDTKKHVVITRSEDGTATVRISGKGVGLTFDEWDYAVDIMKVLTPRGSHEKD